MACPPPPSMTEEEWFPSGGPHPTTVSPTLMVTRPPAQIPEGLLDRSRPKASGVVRLPPHVAWSPPYEYDLADRRQRARAYQRVMTEGLADDVLWFIDVDEVVALWADMVLSPHIRAPWERWLRAHGLLDQLVLTPLQERIRAALAGVAGDAEFALVGAGALVASDVVDRPTNDLDFFARYPSPHAETAAPR